MNSTQAVLHPAFTPSRDLSPFAMRLAAVEEDAVPLDPATPLPHDLNASAVCLVRIAASIAVTFAGLWQIYTVLSGSVGLSWSGLESIGFELAVGFALMAAGVMLMANKSAALAITILVPLSVHVLFESIL
jgi:hypothetical protein